MEEKIEQLLKDFSLFARFYTFVLSHNETVWQKNAAVQQQDFARAAALREQEALSHVTLSKIKEELKEMLKRYE